MKIANIEPIIAKYIVRNNLMNKQRLQLVALSGGADSVALLLVLAALGYQVEAVHCNFNLRGDEAARDEQFSVELCQTKGVKLHRAHFDTRSYAQLHGVSIEMAARQLRYTYFKQLLEILDCETVCVGHHRDDSVETILLNLVRGTGVRGLTGISPKNGAIVRPLLCVDREDVLGYLHLKGQSFVTDSSNLVADVKRNKIRLQILPLLEELNPSFRTTLMTMAEEMQEVEKVSTAFHQHYPDASEVSIAALRQAPSAELALFYFLHPKGFSSAQIRNISESLDASTGKHWTSPTHELIIDRGQLMTKPIDKDTPRAMRLPEPAYYCYANEITLRVSLQDRNADFQIPRSADMAALDVGKVAFPLTIRRTEDGDRFNPFGMKGTKLVSDFLTDQKKNIWEKRHQLVVTDAKGDIIWVVGNRPDGRFCITDKTTRVLLLEKEAAKQ